LPDNLTNTICKFFNVDPKKFNAPGASVQTLSDRASKYYSSFETLAGRREVGLPLLVHRRCSEPMFSISNQLAYENMMVQAKTESFSDIAKVLGPSAWFHVEGASLNKWCPEEGYLLNKLLTEIKMRGCSPDFYVVTPFVVVQNHLRRILERGVLDRWVEDPYLWAFEHVGTIHTVQGREAEAVFFVLGAQDKAQFMARRWAGQSPNLLNVAVSRAKEVLYVIGNQTLWKEAGVFQILDSLLAAHGGSTDSGR
jgi:hypothetical protein